MLRNAAEILEAELGPASNDTERPKSKRTPVNGEFRLFDEANSVDTIAVLDRLSIAHESTPRGEMAVCPGCGEPEALVCKEGGLKCLHARCAGDGPKGFPGFRSNTDLVMLVKRADRKAAANQICDWFGIAVPKGTKKTSAQPSDEAWEPKDSDAPNEPPPPSGKAEEAQKPKGKTSISVSEVLTEWAEHGPLIHQSTGIPQLDDFTGGGPVYGTRWYLAGSPDAGKTALLVQLAHVFMLRGVTVGLLAVDEEAGDIVTRFAQRIGYSRTHCEVRDPLVLVQMEQGLGGLPLRIYDHSWTIEDAAADLAKFAKLRAEQDPAAHPNGPRAMLGVDSVQTVKCAADLAGAAGGRELSEVSAVTARVQAIRAAASRHRLIALATSELGRGAYRSSDPAQQTTTLASGKWSGAIEYSARVLLGLRSVADEPDLVELELAKNKHGQRDVKTYLRIDRRCQTLTPAVYDAPPPASSADRDAAARDRVTADAIVVARVMLAKPGLPVREFRNAVKSASGIGHDRIDTAITLLGDAVIRGQGPNRSTPLSLDIAKLPADVKAALDEPK